MMVVVTGGSGSGKSAYAESLFQEFSGEKIYIATMQVYDEEGKAKVARHRKLREGKGFLTVESPENVGELFAEAAFSESKDTLPDENTFPDAKNPQNEKSALLECVSNLTANEMFREDGIVACKQVADKIIEDIQKINSRLDNLVIVTNNVFEDGITYDSTTMDYLKAMGQINAVLAKQADQVIEVVCGIPVRIK